MTAGDRTKTLILAAGLRLWARGIEPTPSSVAREAGLTSQAVSYHFNSAWRLREALAYQAVRDGNSRVIVQLIGCGHGSVKNISAEERALHLSHCN